MTDLSVVQTLIETGRFNAALKLLAGLPSGPRHAVLAAAAHVGRKQGRAAVDLLLPVLADNPDHAEALFQLGRARLLTSDACAAVAAFERVAALAPSHPGLAEALAGAYRRDARYADAIRLAEATPEAGRQLRYEAAVAHWRLGDARAALAAFDAIVADHPDHAASWFGGAAPALDLEGAAAALGRLERACACPGANGKYWGHLCALLLLAGRTARAEEIGARHVAPHPRRRPPAESVAALLPHLAGGWRLFGVSAALLRHAVAQAPGEGLVLEFGVRRGASIDHIAAVAGQEVHGFDSFEGLPESWGNEGAGVLTTGRQLPAVRGNVRLHAGWFEDTLPRFLAGHPGPVRLVNIDSDLYASARTVLRELAPRLGAGAVLVFDEFIGNRTWREDEYRAFMEFAAETGRRWEILAVGPFTKQVAIRLLP